MKLWLEDNKGNLHEVADQVEDYDLSKTFAASDLISDIRNEIEAHRNES